MVLDQNMSVLEGSIGMLPRRIVVDDEHEPRARQLLDRRRPRPRAAPRWRLSRSRPPKTPCWAGGSRLRQPRARAPGRARRHPARSGDRSAPRRACDRTRRGRRRRGTCAGAARRRAERDAGRDRPGACRACRGQRKRATDWRSAFVRGTLDVTAPDGEFADVPASGLDRPSAC